MNSGHLHASLLALPLPLTTFFSSVLLPSHLCFVCDPLSRTKVTCVCPAEWLLTGPRAPSQWPHAVPGTLEAGIVSCVSRGVLDTGAWFNCKVYEEQVFSDSAQEACAKAKVK